MKLSDAFPSKYLRAADLDKPVLVTIKKVTQQTIGDDVRLVIEFAERDLQELVCNVTNARSISKIAGSDDTDDWSDVQIVLYVTEVSFKGDTVDAIRVRAPKASKVTPGKPTKRVVTVEDPMETAPPTNDDEPPF